MAREIVVTQFACVLSNRIVMDALNAIVGQDAIATEEQEEQKSRRSRFHLLMPSFWSRTRPPAAAVTATSSSSRLSSWLRQRSKSNPLLRRPWKRRSRKAAAAAAAARLAQRDLPPVPPPAPLSVPEEADDEEEELALRMSQMSPNTAFLPPDDFDGIVATSSTGPNNNVDFSQSLETVKNRGWYWGPISGEAAERLLASEPDGSFVVRDSSDHHYIFSLTFKLNGSIRHVRIEHDQGNFSFGSYTKFKSNTIVDFVENAVEHSRSGRFKMVQSLQHQCRFVILRLVPRDLLHKLPIPPKVQDYLNTSLYYSELMEKNCIEGKE